MCARSKKEDWFLSGLSAEEKTQQLSVLPRTSQGDYGVDRSIALHFIEKLDEQDIKNLDKVFHKALASTVHLPFFFARDGLHLGTITKPIPLTLIITSHI